MFQSRMRLVGPVQLGIEPGDDHEYVAVLRGPSGLEKVQYDMLVDIGQGQRLPEGVTAVRPPITPDCISNLMKAQR